MSGVGHQRRFERSPRTSGLPPKTGHIAASQRTDEKGQEATHHLVTRDNKGGWHARKRIPDAVREDCIES